MNNSERRKMRDGYMDRRRQIYREQECEKHVCRHVCVFMCLCMCVYDRDVDSDIDRDTVET